MEEGRAEIEVGDDGVAVIRVVNPPVNSLSIKVLFSLKDRYEEALRRNDVKAIVLVGARGRFSAGIDLSILGGGQVEEIKRGASFASIDVITDLEGARKPSVAAINGIAIGGGLELAMACHARICISTALLGMPELPLGIIPGLGGTQRLPRLVGLSKALEMILMSKLIKGEEAHELGLVDAIVPPEELLKTARQWALDIAECRKPWIKSLYKTDKIEPREEARDILNFTRAQAQKQAPNLDHPLLCIDVIEEGIVFGPRAGIWKETNVFQQLVVSDTSKSLIHVFFAQRAASKVPGITDLGLSPRKITRVAIVGGGPMGSEIATALIIKDYPVILKEANQDFLNAGIDRVKVNLQSRVRKGNMTREKCEKALSLLTGLLDYKSFKDIDMVIEAVTDKVSSNQQIFAELEEHSPPHCILVSTSMLELNMIGERGSQNRIIGAHFFSPAAPAYGMPLLEIVRTEKTSPQVVVDLLSVGRKIRRTPIVVRNCTGFAVDRMFFPYAQAALLLADHGLDVYKIDQSCTEFGMRMGPFRLADAVGLEISVAKGMQYLHSYPKRCYKSMLIPIMLEDKRAGEATRKGFYIYDEKSKASSDQEMKKYIEKSITIAGISPNPELLKLQEEDIVEMLFFPVVNEACRVLEEGIAMKASDLDIASILAMGFPPYRGGIMFWADSLGVSYVCRRLEEWSMAYGEEFFKPCTYLVERAVKGIPLSGHVSNQSKARL